MITRRALSQALAAVPLIGAGPSGAIRGARVLEELDDDVGVTSGSPHPSGFVIWTRVPQSFRRGVADGASIEVRFEVATSPDMAPSSVVSRGVAQTSSRRDFTVKARVDGLGSDRVYHYRFSTSGGYSSVTGRARTAPPHQSRRELTIAAVSCQSFSAGFYSAYLALAREPIDFVVHLGDHIYERDRGRSGAPDPLSGREARTLDDYRKKYRYYLSDPAWREARRLFTWIDIWDDHEVFNDYSSADIDATPARFSAAFQAFAEYMPVAANVVTDPRGRPSLALYGATRLGSLVDLYVLDQRQFRSAMPCDEDFMTIPCAQAKLPSQTMLGALQKAWLKESLSASETTWRLLLNEVMMSSFFVPSSTESATRAIAEVFHGKVGESSGRVLNLDAWDGFPAERQELLEFIGRGIENVVTLTGDIHSAYNSVLRTDPSDAASPPVAVEIVSAAISSWPLIDSLTRPLGAGAENVVREHNPHFEWLDLASNGYTLLRFSASELKVTHVAADASQPNGASRVVREARVPSGRAAFV